MISVTALAGVPEFVRSAYGEKTLQRAQEAAKFDLDSIMDPDGFMPHLVMSRFVRSVARLTGQSDFGMLLAPHLAIRNYGCWGAYLLEAETLGAATVRAIDANRFHSSDESVRVQISDDVARISYPSAARGKEGYAHIACGVAGVLLSLCREFLSPRWVPLRVELDIPRPRLTWPYEEQFRCPVWFESEAPAVCLETRYLTTRLTRPVARPLLTLDDVARSRAGHRDADFSSIVAEQIRLQLLYGTVSVDRIASVMDLSVRTLQRELNRCGTGFRDIATAVRIRRAANLLKETTLPITRISADLGYSAPAHFARAFRKAMGQSPSEYRHFLGISNRHRAGNEVVYSH